MVELMKFIIPLIILAGAYLLSFVVNFILGKAVHLAKKTATTLDDEILMNTKNPIRILFLFLGVYFGIRHYNPNTTLFNMHFSQYFIIIGIVLGAYIVSNIIGSFFRWYSREIASSEKKNVDNTLLKFLSRFSIIIIYVIALIIILSRLGVEIAPLVAGLGIAGLAIALALQDTLSNLFSAVYITADKPVKIGDYIELDTNIRGYVEDVGWRSTRIRTLGNNKIIMPNSKLANSIITNYDESNHEMSVRVSMGVSYSSDLEKVEKTTIDVAKKIQQTVEGAVKTHEPFIRYNEFGDSSINFTVIMRAKQYSYQFIIIHEFIKAVKERYDKEGISIPFPQRDIWIKKP